MVKSLINIFLNTVQGWLNKIPFFVITVCSLGFKGVAYGQRITAMGRLM